MKSNIFHASASCLAYQRRLSNAYFAVEIIGTTPGKKGAVPGWEKLPLGRKKATNSVAAIKTGPRNSLRERNARAQHAERLVSMR
jgi:hypothetical protein